MAYATLAKPEEHIPEDWRLTREEMVKLATDQEWRLNNLYKIKDRYGRVVTFKMNWAQRQLFKGMWFLNIILKARQLGMSTFIQLFMLDCCLFNETQSALIIAHGKKEAMDLFSNKIKFAYDNLPGQVRRLVRADNRSALELRFSNGSSISVSNSGRSGTFQMLHISEFGKICRKYPDKAREIVTGAFEAIHPGSMIFIESTAEGREGKFYDMTMEAKRLHDSRALLSKMDYKFWFLPWWQHPENVIDATNIIIFPYLNDYFDSLQAKLKITLTKGQKAWYAKKIATLGEDMKREHPSTPEEAFENIVEGAYWAKQVTLARQDGRIGKVPHQQGVAVDTYWDLGLNDTMACWFIQRVGASYHVIDYYENSGEGLEHYWKVLQEKSVNLGYSYGRHVWPHDGGHRHLGLDTRTVDAQALDLGWRVEILERGNIQEGIEAVRNMLSMCYFDEERTDSVQTGYAERTGGILALESYRKEWDERLGSWKRTPRHDWSSHGADAFRTFAMTARMVLQGRSTAYAKPVAKKRIV